MQRGSAMPQTAPSENPFALGRSQALRLGLGMAALGRPGYINLGHGEDYPDGRSVEAMQARARQVLDDAQVHRALARLKADGLRIGLTLSGPTQADVLRRAMDIRVDGVALFDSVQATWNLLEPSAGAALAWN
jgi:hypothetical protein